MSELNIIRLQHGQSNTAANNFTTTAEAANGTMKLLARGNPGATTQDIITVDASGVVDHPQGLKIAGTSGQRMMLMAAKATTSGTAVDFSPADGTGIPSWAKRVTVLLNGVSASASSSQYMLQLGAGSVQTTGYESTASSGNSATNATTGLVITANLAAAGASLLRGAVELYLFAGNTWISKGMVAPNGVVVGSVSGGGVTLSGALDRIRLTTITGADAFDAGSVSLLIEGY